MMLDQVNISYIVYIWSEELSIKIWTKVKMGYTSAKKRFDLSKPPHINLKEALLKKSFLS